MNRVAPFSACFSAELGRREGSQTARGDEMYYTPQEVAERLKVTPKHVRGMFENEPGVIFLPSPGKASKRRYRVMRIPEKVLCEFCVKNSVGHTRTGGLR